FHLSRLLPLPVFAHFLGSVVEELGRIPHHRVPAGEVFESRAFAPVQDGVADLAGAEVEPAVQLAVEDQPAADAGADEDAEHVLGLLGRAVRELAVGAELHVVLEVTGPGPSGVGDAGQLLVAPVEVGGVADAAGALIDLPGDAHPQAADFIRWHGSRADGFLCPEPPPAQPRPGPPV